MARAGNALGQFIEGWFALDRGKVAHMDKKRHHYVPKAYLKFFCDAEGEVRVYLKDNPNKVIHQAPDKTGFHKYYYSQPLPEGGKDHNTLEDIFSELESKWPPIVERLQQRENVKDSLEDLFAFIALQRVRVPASRDVSEKMLAELVMATMRRLDVVGKFPPKPKGFEDILDHVEVEIDPHMSIHMMAHKLQGVRRVFDQIGLGAFHNTTDIPFLTSDNPVIWFDPSVPEAEMQPYVLKPDGPIVLLFPVTPNLMIYGNSFMREPSVYDGLRHRELSERRHVKVMNRQICRFAYKAVFVQKVGQEALIRKYAHFSPVLRTDVIPGKEGEFLFHQQVFGKRKRKPKWEG